MAENISICVDPSDTAVVLQLGKQLQGCFVFTSSAAATILSPMTVMYSATKAFLSYFGASLAAEVRHAGIDVLVLHPGAVNTRHASLLCIGHEEEGRWICPACGPSTLKQVCGRGQVAVHVRSPISIGVYQTQVTNHVLQVL